MGDCTLEAYKPRQGLVLIRLGSDQRIISIYNRL